MTAACLRTAALLLVCTFSAPAVASTAVYAPGTLEDRIDLLVRAGYDRPAEALAGLAQLRSNLPSGNASPASTRQLMLAQGIVEAQAGHSQFAAVLAARLASLSREQNDSLAGGASDLLGAVAAEHAGDLAKAATLARSALAAYQPRCPRSALPAGGLAASAAKVPAGAGCDYRALWHALQLLQRRALGVDELAVARDHAQAALDLAESAGDPYRASQSLGVLAVIAARNGQHDIAQRSVAQARRVAADASDRTALVHVRINEARLAALRPADGADASAGTKAAEEAVAMAQRAGARRLAASIQAELGEAYIRQKRPADALRVLDAALATMREFHDQPQERALLKHAGIAKIGLRRIPEGKGDLDRVLTLWKQGGEPAGEVQTLVDYGVALAAAGDARGALDLFHRERALSAEVAKQSQNILLTEMQARYDVQAKQRSIDAMTRENAAKTTALEGRDLLQRIWLLVAAVLTVSVVLAVVLYRRVRVTQRELNLSIVKLRVASERDPLTNLANRRQFQSVMQTLHGTPERGFSGALLLVDLDHFKHVNDEHGHAAGDDVLVEVAQRLNDAVGPGNLVVRWGGEEFLILAGQPSGDDPDRIAARVLEAVAGRPVIAEGKALRVTASVGHARFPLPTARVPVDWEQAVNLCDMALYTAKNQGRNRAIGIASTKAADARELRDIERDFERASQQGRVTLHSVAGP